MNGRDFIRRVQRWGKDHGQAVIVDASRGKGGHQRLAVGDHWTTVQTGELKPRVFHAMLKQLAIPKEEF